MRDKANRRILEAARSVFARRGLGATVSDIAKEAGVSQGLAYRYFPSKEAIFHTLLRQMLQSGESTNSPTNREGLRGNAWSASSRRRYASGGNTPSSTGSSFRRYQNRTFPKTYVTS